MSESANNSDAFINEFNRIYNETYAILRKYVAARCSDINYVPDILQQSYLDYYKLIFKKGIGHVNNPLSVLFKIAKRKIFRYYSLKDRLKIFIPNTQKDRESHEYLLTDNEGIYEHLVDDKILQSIEIERLWSIINNYPADTRKIFYLYFYEEMTLSKIAENMRLSLSNVKHRLYRTLDEIRKREQNHE